MTRRDAKKSSWGKGMRARTHAAVNCLVLVELANRAAGLGFIKLGRDQLVAVESWSERNEPCSRNLYIVLSILMASLQAPLEISGCDHGCGVVWFHTE